MIEGQTGDSRSKEAGTGLVTGLNSKEEDGSIRMLANPTKLLKKISSNALLGNNKES